MARITASLADDPQSLPRDTVRPGDAIRILVEPDQAGEYVYEWRLPPGAATDADLSGPVAIMYFDQHYPCTFNHGYAASWRTMAAKAS
jgi:hypothetical protein